MKRVILMLVATAAFACTTAVAQAGGGAGGGTAGSAGASGNAGATGQQGTQNGESGNQDMGQTGSAHGKHHKGGSMDANGGSGKAKTLTGCLSSSPDSSGMYTLSNGKYKSGIEVGPTDKVKDHAGHQVALKGNWNSGGATGENAGVASSTANNGKSFNVDSVKHISDTCKEAPGGGTMGHKGHKKDKNSGDTSGSTNTPPPSL